MVNCNYTLKLKIHALTILLTRFYSVSYCFLAKAKKLEEQRKKTEPLQEQEERHGEEVKQEDNRKRRVVVRRISGQWQTLC